MLFYLYKNPPECMVDLDSVEALILERFQHYFLHTVLQYDTEKFNYYDRISHLVISVIAVSSPYFKETFFKGETKLFRDRLQFQKGSDIKKALTEAAEYFSDLFQSEEYKTLKPIFSNQFQLMQSVTEAILSKSSHCFRKLHSKSCRKYKLTLPFTFLLNLVAKREVEVKNGKVSLCCGLWNEMLEVIFEYLLQIELELIENCEDLRKEIFESEDDRLRQLIKRFNNFLNGSMKGIDRVIEANEIDEMSLYFPPCMANLHQILRRTHRLSYDSRYQYTLFLRDIGVSVDGNILFWENEYKKPHKNSACTHYWKENQKRYKYQIQHIYGLTGSHEHKTSHSCEKFIQDLQIKMDGGCPFQHLTQEQLEKTLPKSVAALPDVEDIFLYKNNAMPQKACAVYLSCLQKMSSEKRMKFSDDKMDTHKWFYIINPLQFYNIAKNF